jgi:hypothetical protein
VSDLRSQLEAIYLHRGKLTPEMVVDTARPKKHPLHARFEWDDKIAGEAHRRQQAHDLITSVKVVFACGEKAEKVRAFHAVRGTEEEYVYMPAEKIAADPMLREVLLRDMEREWKQMHSRYGHFQEFVELVTADLGKTA